MAALNNPKNVPQMKGAQITLNQFAKNFDQLRKRRPTEAMYKILMRACYDILLDMINTRTFFDTGGIKKLLTEGLRLTERRLKWSIPAFHDTKQTHTLSNPNPAVVYWQEDGYRARTSISQYKAAQISGQKIGPRAGKFVPGRKFAASIKRDVEAILVPMFVEAIVKGVDNMIAKGAKTSAAEDKAIITEVINKYKAIATQKNKEFAKSMNHDNRKYSSLRLGRSNLKGVKTKAETQRLNQLKQRRENRKNKK